MTASEVPKARFKVGDRIRMRIGRQAGKTGIIREILAVDSADIPYHFTIRMDEKFGNYGGQRLKRAWRSDLELISP